MGDHALIPLSVILQRVQDVLRIRVHQVGPCFPQRMNDVVDETHLKEKAMFKTANNKLSSDALT